MRQPLTLVLAILLVLVAFAANGCHWGAQLGLIPASQPISPIDNPLMVPTADREFLWNQLVDTVDDYFRIEREERVKFIDGSVTEGYITTYPTVGSTLLEPWRSDSAHGYERVLATLQSIQRRAEIRVIPVAEGYQIHVAVFKEQEEVSQSEHATVGAVVQRHDGSLVRRDRWKHVNPADASAAAATTIAWTPLGRDVQLEQRMLAEIVGRLRQGGCAVPPMDMGPRYFSDFTPHDAPTNGDASQTP